MGDSAFEAAWREAATSDASSRPPPEDVNAALLRLEARADLIARDTSAALAAAAAGAGDERGAAPPPTPPLELVNEIEKRGLDLVVAGSGFKDLYALGVHQVLSRLGASSSFSPRRYSGASSGAQCGFQLVLRGERRTVQEALTWGYLSDRFPCSLPWAALRADRCWRELGGILVDRHRNELSEGALDGRVFVSVTMLGLFPPLSNRLISEFAADLRKTAEVFYATGTFLACIGGGRHLATDGGVTLNAPLFVTGERPQLVVDPLKARGLPWWQAMAFGLARGENAIERGQDDIARLLRGEQATGGGGGALKLLSAAEGAAKGKPPSAGARPACRCLRSCAGFIVLITLLPVLLPCFVCCGLPFLMAVRGCCCCCCWCSRSSRSSKSSSSSSRGGRGDGRRTSGKSG